MMANLRGAIRAGAPAAALLSIALPLRALLQLGLLLHNPESSQIDHGLSPDIATDGTHMCLAKSQSLSYES